jgi:hypothetical protein
MIERTKRAIGIITIYPDISFKNHAIDAIMVIIKLTPVIATLAP